MKSETVKSLTKQFYNWRIAAKNYITELKYPVMRALFSIDVADAQGKLNGITAAELLTAVNLTAGTGENFLVRASGKTVTFYAVQKAKDTPADLR